MGNRRVRKAEERHNYLMASFYFADHLARLAKRAMATVVEDRRPFDFWGA